MLADYYDCQQESVMARMVCMEALTSSEQRCTFLDRVDEYIDTYPEASLKLLISLQKVCPVEEQFDFLPQPFNAFFEERWPSLLFFESSELAVSGGVGLTSYLALNRFVNKVPGFKKLFVVLGSLTAAALVATAWEGGAQDKLERKWAAGVSTLEQEHETMDARAKFASLKTIAWDAVQLADSYDNNFEEVINQTLQRVERLEIEGAGMYLNNLRRYVQVRNALLEGP